MLGVRKSHPGYSLACRLHASSRLQGTPVRSAHERPDPSDDGSHGLDGLRLNGNGRAPFPAQCSSDQGDLESDGHHGAGAGSHGSRGRLGRRLLAPTFDRCLRAALCHQGRGLEERRMDCSAHGAPLGRPHLCPRHGARTSRSPAAARTRHSRLCSDQCGRPAIASRDDAGSDRRDSNRRDSDRRGFGRRRRRSHHRTG